MRLEEKQREECGPLPLEPDRTCTPAPAPALSPFPWSRGIMSSSTAPTPRGLSQAQGTARPGNR